jgi:hypothetical protein
MLLNSETRLSVTTTIGRGIIVVTTEFSETGLGKR